MSTEAWHFLPADGRLQFGDRAVVRVGEPLHALVHDQQARRLTRTELRVIAELQAVRNKVQEDDERDL